MFVSMTEQELIRLALAFGLVNEKQVDECRGGDGASVTASLVARGYLQPGALDRLREEFEQVTVKPAASAIHASGAVPVLPLVPPEVAAAQRDERNVRGKHVLLRELGRGGMGEVWLAWQSDLMRRVALKYLTSTAPEDRERFKREAQTAARLKHPNIVSVYEVGVHLDGNAERPYIAMEFIDGGTLAESVRGDGGPAKRRDRVAQVRDAARAVGHAHRQGVVHRDMKPQNILIAKDGAVFVTDFGLARMMGSGSSLSQTGALIGTPDYMSPEQASGEIRSVGAPSDVYSLGATLYFALTGRAPFAGANAGETLARVIWDDPTPARSRDATIPPDLETVCSRAMEKEPELRYGSAEAFADDLTRWLDGEPIHARPVSWTGAMLRRARKHRVVTALLAALVVVVPVGTWLGVVATRQAAERRRLEGAERSRQEKRDRARVPYDRGREAFEILTRRLVTEDTTTALREPYVTAVAQLTQAVAIDPDFTDAHELLGRTHAVLSDDRNAEASLSRAVQLDPHRTTALIERGKSRVHRFITTAFSVGGYFADGRFHAVPTKRTPEVLALRDAARADFEAAARERGTAREIELSRALIAFLDEDPGACALLQRLAAADETDTYVAWTLAVAQWAAQDLKGCEASCRTVLRYRPSDMRAHAMRGYVARMEDRLDDALEHLDRSLRSLPIYSHAIAMRTRVLIEQRKYDEARQGLEGAIRAHPDWAVLVDAQAFLDLMTCRYAEAEAGYTRLMTVWGDLAHPWSSRAEARIMLGKFDEAERDLVEAERLAPKDVEWRYARASLELARGNATNALDVIERALGAAKTPSASAYDLKGRALMALGRTDDAFAAYTAAIESDPSLCGPRLNRAEIFVVRKEYDRALADVDRALALGPQTAEAHQNRAQVLRRMGRRDEAHAALDRALAMKPELRLAMESKARWCCEDERFPEALAATDAILRLEPKSAFWLATRGAILANMGKLKDALAAYRAAIDADPTWRERVADDVKAIEEALKRRDE